VDYSIQFALASGRKRSSDSPRAGKRIQWLVLDRSSVDVCAKDPGFPIDLIFRGNIADFVAVFLGPKWRDMEGKRAIDRGRPQTRQAASRLDSP
jgi:hypothetical protein